MRSKLLLNQPLHHAGAHRDQEYFELKRLVFWALTSMVPLTVLTVIIGIISDSLTIDVVAIDAGGGLILHLFNIISIGVVLRQNTFKYPYGTGKLENFSGFLYAMIVIPGSLLIVISAVKRYLHPPAAIDFGSAQLLLILWFVRDAWMLYWSARICRGYPDRSPMTQSYLVNMKLSVIYDLVVLAGIMLGFRMYSAGRINIAIGVDLLIAVLVALYICYCAVGLLVRNFRSLIDMPLPEADQYRILNALVADFDVYEGIGNIYSQLSGNTRLIQVEIYVDPATTAEDIDRLRNRIEGRLQGQFGRLLFHLIPLVRRTDKPSVTM